MARGDLRAKWSEGLAPKKVEDSRTTTRQVAMARDDQRAKWSKGRQCSPKAPPIQNADRECRMAPPRLRRGAPLSALQRRSCVPCPAVPKPSRAQAQPCPDPAASRPSRAQACAHAAAALSGPVAAMPRRHPLPPHRPHPTASPPPPPPPHPTAFPHISSTVPTAPPPLQAPTQVGPSDVRAPGRRVSSPSRNSSLRRLAPSRTPRWCRSLRHATRAPTQPTRSTRPIRRTIRRELATC